ncbi:hypothetical protein PRUPE_3G196400 [Prunus persica]|uniref:SAWADEE domain-containing protein n=1 Tax=Prunus persica TaxID=3760 RepID=A0A251Q2Q6_PRUPE|nr:uncharacterized protein LOC18783990 isoform X2 [Prunus persica]ONI18089.1 hypothetical protein PRUPE_3G196400 [Prunus persica]
MALEFRSQMDDAWYDARIVMDGYDCLRVKFIGFPDDHDEVFDANNLTSFKDIAEFRRRFRPVSVQVQDNECSQVAKGTLVCVAHAVCPDDRRFYDAVVYKVLHEEHRFVKGEEECPCSFILFWRHGPKAGCLTVQDLENICRVQPRRSKMNPLLTSFLETAREKIEITLSKICATPHEPAYDEKACRPSVSQRLKQKQQQSRRSETMNELKVFASGTEEYKKGKLRKDLFWEFANHQCQLHQRLLIEEGRIWHLSNAMRKR